MAEKLPRSTSQFIARRYLAFKQKDSYISYMIKLCSIGIGIGTLALMLTVIITDGFEHEISKKMQGINSDAVIFAPGTQQLNPIDITKYLAKNMPGDIYGISGSSTRHVLLEHNGSYGVLFLRGINPIDEARTTTLEHKVITNTRPPGSKIPARSHSTLTHLLPRTGNSVIIGSKVAKKYNLSVGDQLTLRIPTPRRRQTLKLDKQIVTISGIFEIGLEEYDANGAFCNHKLLEQFYDDITGVQQLAVTFNARIPNNPSANTKRRDERSNEASRSSVSTKREQNRGPKPQVSKQRRPGLVELAPDPDPGGSRSPAHAGVTLHSRFQKWVTTAHSQISYIIKKVSDYLFWAQSHNQPKTLLKKLKNLLMGVPTYGWQELYPALVSSLALEKYVISLVLLLISLVASMNMISLLFMYLQQKQRDIAILRAMGASEKIIRRIFLRIGITVTLRGLVPGLLIAYGIGYWLKHYPCIKLPDVYYVSYLPASIRPSVFFIVFFATLLLGFIATVIPIRRLKNFSLSRVLRQ